MGHGTASAEDLAALLRDAGVGLVVDVRRFPGSRRHPHFGRDQMQEWLPAHGVAYRWEERLGGRRPPPSDSADEGLRNASFRGYAAWMRGADFRAALDEVLADASRQRTAVMCSESVWWRCHRRLVADAVVVLHDRPVQHLMPGGRLVEHVPTDVARQVDEQLRYDGTAHA